MDAQILKIIIPHTAPVMPVISGIQHATITIPDDENTKKIIQKINLLNNSIFLKAEFAKQAYYIIHECYRKYGRLLESGMYHVNPLEMLPAWREIDNLIFELGSILDFFSREVNLAFNLGIPKHKVSFTSVVKTCQKKIPDGQITTSLVNFSNSELHEYFRGMRNRITHRLPFVFRGMNDQIFFPDNPNDDEVNPSTDQQIDISIMCRKWIYEILEFVDQTSLIVFQKIAKIKAYEKDTGREMTIEEFIETQRKGLEKRLL